MVESAQRVLEYLTEVEVAAEDILADRQQVRFYKSTDNDKFHVERCWFNLIMFKDCGSGSAEKQEPRSTQRFTKPLNKRQV